MMVSTGFSGWIRAALIKRRSLGEQAALGTVLVAAPVLLRLLIDPVPATMPFMAFWPTVLIATLLLDLRQALATVAVSFCVSKLVFGGQVVSVDWWAGRAITFVLAVFSLGLLICTAVVTRSTVRELDALASRQESFNRELRHRTRNMLAIIQALSARGPRAENPLDFFREFSSRLESLAKASDLLRIGTEAEGRLPDLIERTIHPFGLGRRIRLEGTACVIPDESCIPLIMAIHELCTNAMKHGALSTDRGLVDLRWFLGPDGNRLYLLWRETGGPAVSAPQVQGTGSHLLRAQPGIEAVDLMFDPKGVWCEMLIIGARPEGALEVA
ncbi:sensor histidine kinase [Novosphingobium pituita]|uniref:histidine kinase n=1 Tax=Novosphingobium pituita TaxID=3056842 RepID=A0ABQ6PCF4_9SPHN|nr:sensor histidine kinase [Novosphingobium sp. IK01]MDK4806390.1 sensor histidine kinase [Novosphingobium aromaticivorans]GMM62189.1 hypothetical protein NUTIK01_29660 [Novosphingobium sp. IK01]HIQ17500.1 sensor histidine kinase [Novosphingobium capsulatum]